MADHENPWKTLSTKRIYDNPWITVDEHQVINPSGNPGIYGKVHFKNLACAIIPLDDDHNTWIVGQYRYTLNDYSWEIPMGGVPVGSDPLVGAKRELKEETGISAEEWQPLLKVHLSNSITDEAGVVFLARNLSYGETEFDDTEKLEIRKLPFTELLEMAHNGEITDVLSVAAVLKLAGLLRG